MAERLKVNSRKSGLGDITKQLWEGIRDGTDGILGHRSQAHALVSHTALQNAPQGNAWGGGAGDAEITTHSAAHLLPVVCVIVRTCCTSKGIQVCMCFNDIAVLAAVCWQKW